MVTSSGYSGGVEFGEPRHGNRTRRDLAETFIRSEFKRCRVRRWRVEIHQLGLFHEKFHPRSEHFAKLFDGRNSHDEGQGDRASRRGKFLVEQIRASDGDRTLAQLANRGLLVSKSMNATADDFPDVASKFAGKVGEKINIFTGSARQLRPHEPFCLARNVRWWACRKQSYALDRARPGSGTCGIEQRKAVAGLSGETLSEVARPNVSED